MKKVVLFDFHNTLATCDSWLDLEISSLPANVLQRLGLENGEASLTGRRNEATVRFKALRSRVKASGRELSALEGTLHVFAELGVKVDPADVERAVVALEEEALLEVEPVAGALRAMERLHDAGCLLGVVSSAGYPAFVESALESLAMRPLLNGVWTTAGEGIYKSDPEIYRRAVKHLGAEPGEAVHVGDHPVFDVQTARRAGLSTVWFAAHAARTAQTRGEPWKEAELAGSEADAIIMSMDELYTAIEGLS